jgi:hypothetical protein
MITAQVIGSVGVSTSRQFIGAAFRIFNQPIQKLFENGEQGFFYDPNDLSTMFQQPAGITPVTAAGQPVGLVLDKSKGLIKSEINMDVNFDNPSIWIIQPAGTSEISISGGLLSCNSTTNASVFQSEASFSASTRYTIEIDVVSYTRGDPFIMFGGVKVYIPKSVGKHIVSFTTTLAGSLFGMYSGENAVGGEWVASSLSITSVDGNHAYQTTSASRPILQNAPRRIDFDAVDDKLITKLPAQLTGCTVIRSVPNVGTQILTGQTIPTTRIDSIDHCGLLVINRALTASETSQITKLFNKAAGV